MRKIGITLLAGALLLGAGCKNQTTPTTSPSTAVSATPEQTSDTAAQGKAIYDRVEKRVKEQDATPPDSNGYKVLEDAIGFDASDEAKAPYRALSKYSEIYHEKGRDAAVEAMKSGDIEAFLSIVPKLESAVEKPHFDWPSQWEDGPAALLPNFIILRSSAQGLCVLGLKYESQGEYDKAIDSYLLAAKIGAELTGKHQLIAHVVGVAIENIVEEFLGDLLGQGKLSAEQNRRVIKALSELDIQDDDLLNAADGEYSMFIQTLNMIESDELSTEDIGDVSLAEGIVLKMIVPGERAGMTEVYLLQRPDFENLTETVDMNQELEKRKTLILTRLLYSDLARFIHRGRQCHTNLSALKLQAALGAYKAEKKEFPESLDALVPDYLEEVPKNYFTEDGKFVYAKTQDNYSLVTQSPDLEKVEIKGDLVHHPRPTRPE
jgi:tetratricopeptide (TPR) repeat protein